MSKKSLSWDVWDTVLVSVFFVAMFGIYALSGGFRHDEWGYFATADASISVRLRDLMMPLNEHFLPMTKLVQQLVHTFAGPNHLPIAAVNLAMAVFAVGALFAWVRAETESRLAAYVWAALSVLMLLAAFDTITWAAAGLSLFMTVAGFSLAGNQRCAVATRIAGLVVMTFSSSAFPAFTAAIIFVAVARCVVRPIERRELMIAGVAAALAALYFMLRPLSGVPPVSLVTFSVERLIDCELAAIGVIDPLVTALTLLTPLIALAVTFRFKSHRPAVLRCVPLAGAGALIFLLGVFQLYVGRYAVAGCAVIESRHLYIPLVGAALYAAAAFASVGAFGVGQRMPKAAPLIVGAIGLALAALRIAPTVEATYGSDFVAQREEAARSQTAFFRDLNAMICAAERAAMHGMAINLPDPSMTECRDQCGLGFQPPFNMVEYGYSLSTYAAYSQSACLTRRYIRFAPEIPAPRQVPEVGAFYDRYFPSVD